MDCIILCAGYATRLRPLTDNTPKPLLEVAGRPILEHILDRLATTSVKRVFIATNARFADHFSRWIGRIRYATLELHVVNDGTTTNENRLGSMGDVRFVARRQNLTGDFLIINGDNLFTFSLKPLLHEFSRRGNTLALYDVGTKEVASLYGIPTLAEGRRVVGFVEKPKDPSSTLASIGIYAYQGQTHLLLEEYLDGGHSPDKTGEFVEWLHAKADVFGHGYGGEHDVWFDIGTIDQLKEAGSKWESFESQPFKNAAEFTAAAEAVIRKMGPAGSAAKCPAASATSAKPSFSFLVKHLISDNPKARLFAIKVFRDLKSPAAISWLLDVLEDERSVDGTTVSAAAADALVGLRYADTPAAVRTKAAEQGFLKTAG